MRSAIVLLFSAFVSCASAPTPAPAPMARGDEDVVRLKSGETIHGTIVRMDDAQVALESGGRLRVFARRDVQETSFAPKREPLDPVKPVRRGVPPTSWFPRTEPSEKVEQVEVLFFEPHAPAACLGELAEPLAELPELVLFAEPGGKLVLHDARKYGFHAHVQPGNIVRRPTGKPGLTLDVSESVESIAFVSPAQEMKAGERTSYAIPDAIFARVADLGAAEATLASQPFAGGRAQQTVGGTIWALSLPRNDRQWWLYLFDGEKKHGKVMEACYATYEDAVLAPDLVIDMMAADGKRVGRAMLLPMPESLSADGPAPEPVAIRVGSAGAIEARVAVPPRQAIVLPPKTPATKADVDVHYYEVAKSIPEKAITAWGIGKPNGEVSIRTTPLTPEQADDHVKIDLSKLAEDRFPAVAWFYHRRTFVWQRGEGSGVGGHGAGMAPRDNRKPTKVITNQGRLAHVLPILFVGPDPAKPKDDSHLDDAVAGGMSNALLSDALTREAGAAFQTLGTLSNVASSTGGAGGAGGVAQTAATKSGDSVNSVTNVYITIPPHTDMGGFGGALTGGGGAGSQLPLAMADGLRKYPIQWQQYTTPFGNSYNPADFYDPRTATWKQGYQYDPATGTLTGPPQQGAAAQGQSNTDDLIDLLMPNLKFIRKRQQK